METIPGYNKLDNFTDKTQKMNLENINNQEDEDGKDLESENEPTEEDLLNEEKEIEEITDEEIQEYLKTDEVPKDICDKYIAEIRRYPLLNRETEMELSKKILSKGEESVKAKDLLFHSNLRLVIHFAGKKHRFNPNTDFLDLIQEGNIGLLKAVDKFDWKKNKRFATYAAFWIKVKIDDIISAHNPIRLPIDVSRRLGKYKKLLDDFIRVSGQNPNLAEAAKLFGHKKNKAAGILNAIKSDFVSIDQTIENNDESSDSTFHNVLPNNSDPLIRETDTAMVLEDRVLSDIVETFESLKSINDKDKKIFRMIYGLDGNEPKIGPEIGKEMNVSKQRVDQINKKILEKIRMIMGVS